MTRMTCTTRITMAAALLGAALWSVPAQAGVKGWLNWRGPAQNGTSSEKNLPATWTPGGENHLWDIDLPGRGTVVIADRDGKQTAYAWGYERQGADLREVLTAIDPGSGKRLWSLHFNDFMSDITYDRYSIGAPVIDPETGNIYLRTTPGDVVCVSPEGQQLWMVSLMERFGGLTFPNGRTGSPVVDGDLVITRAVTSYWGADGPARDRFLAFNKATGDLVWSSTPGVGDPFLKDSSFSTPYLTWAGDKRVFYVGLGCGNLVGVNARTGEPIWRHQMALGGINVSPVIFEETIIATHGMENIDASTAGRMIAYRLGAAPEAGGEAPVVVGFEREVWRNPTTMFTSSPTLVGDRVYQCTQVGELACVNAKTGEILWTEKLAPSQLHASPLYADGKLYVPMENGLFYILRPSDTGAEVLAKVQLEGHGLGSPSVYDGKIFVHTTEKLYCFGSQRNVSGAEERVIEQYVRKTPGKATRLSIVPVDVLLQPGEAAFLSVRSLDESGHLVKELPGSGVTWSSFIPPTARVRSEVDAKVSAGGEIRAGSAVSAGAIKAESRDLLKLSGTMRARVLPAMPLEEDFEGFAIDQSGGAAEGPFAYPPLPWIGARLKWEIRELEGNKVLVKTLDSVLFQRAMSFIGHPDASGYTMEADVMTDGNRRIMSNVGLINQRYIIALIGNWQILEVSSNHDRIKVSVPFPWQANKWYRLKTRVDVASDGSGVVRAKAWERGAPEPEAWTIEVPHEHAHTHGAPGLFGYSPQSRMSVYVDNVVVRAND